MGLSLWSKRPSTSKASPCLQTGRNAGGSLPIAGPATFKSPLPVLSSHKREPLLAFGENTRA